jgi:glycosyltransferase involved in cell wall biosynthesis
VPQVTKVSFFIPAFNCASTIAATVDSVFAQNFDDGDEIVIVNDASTDATADVLKKIVSIHPEVQIINHGQNEGGGAARNTAVRATRNNLLFCLDSDNLLYPRSVRQLKRALVNHGADVASFGELHYFSLSPRLLTHKWIFKSGQISLADYLAGSIVPGASGNYLFSRDSWKRADGYLKTVGPLDTWSFGLKQVATGSTLIVVPGTAYLHRVSSTSYWAREARTARLSLDARDVLAPFASLIHPDDWTYINSERHRLDWFLLLDAKPLRTVGGEQGRSGKSVRPLLMRAKTKFLRKLCFRRKRRDS